MRQHALAPAIRYADAAAQRAAKVATYSATLVRFQRRVTPQGLQPAERSRMQLKIRSQPFSVYMKFEEPAAGREVMYIDGWNQNRLIVHEGSGPLSFVGTISLDPKSPRAMESGRPITQAGLANLARGVADEWRDAIARGLTTDETTVQFFPEAMLGDVEVEAIETTMARRVTSTNTHKLRLFLTRDSKLPIAMQAYAFPPQQGGRPASTEPELREDVRYLQLDVRTPLNARDFDPENPAYDF